MWAPIAAAHFGSYLCEKQSNRDDLFFNLLARVRRMCPWGGRGLEAPAGCSGGAKSCDSRIFLHLASASGLDSTRQQLFWPLQTLICALGVLGAREISMGCVLQLKVALHVQCQCDRQDQSKW